MKKIVLMLFILSCFAIESFAKDVYVNGYTRKDGTYVRPHIRSALNQYKWDNYGPSKSDNSELLTPSTSDTDNDGTPNYLDKDDDNDGTQDENDSNQYGE